MRRRAGALRECGRRTFVRITTHGHLGAIEQVSICRIFTYVCAALGSKGGRRRTTARGSTACLSLTCALFYLPARYVSQEAIILSNWPRVN
jgi:hypothetical protein